MAEQKVVAVYSRCHMDPFTRRSRGAQMCLNIAETVTDLEPYFQAGWRVHSVIPTYTGDTMTTTYFVLERARTNSD